MLRSGRTIGHGRSTLLRLHLAHNWVETIKAGRKSFPALLNSADF
jgi:hypothetical protein